MKCLLCKEKETTDKNVCEEYKTKVIPLKSISRKPPPPE